MGSSRFLVCAEKGNMLRDTVSSLCCHAYIDDGCADQPAITLSAASHTAEFSDVEDQPQRN